VALYGLKLALLGFWSAWFAIVTLTNAFSALRGAGKLPASWRFASGNYEQVVKAMSAYDAPPVVAKWLFAGVIAWQFLATVLYATALVSSLAIDAIAWPAVNAAFACGIALWAAFMVADELTFKYAYEQSHELLFIAQLTSLGAMYLLPG
jgi:hypothetical protein